METMVYMHAKPRNGGPGRGSPSRAAGFTLVELMTVIFIIGLLVGILIPSLTAVRNAAKRTSSTATIGALSAGLEAFKNDHDKNFRQTSGYPPSFAHPPIGTFAFNAHEGEFPFVLSGQGQPSRDPATIYGAHWLPAMLIGVDALGVVPRSAVPADLRNLPSRWYASDASPDGPLDRSPLYVDPTGLTTVITEELPGFRPQGGGLFPDWSSMSRMPVIVDAFDQPILYYVSSTYGSTANILEEKREENGSYSPSPPYYFHQDNEGFTGNDGSPGWDFGSGGDHSIARSGAELHAGDVDNAENRETFARFIHDGKAHSAINAPTAQSPLRPLNYDSFLLISAGRDGRYGTADDVTNFPLSTD